MNQSTAAECPPEDRQCSPTWSSALLQLCRQRARSVQFFSRCQGQNIVRFTRGNTHFDYLYNATTGYLIGLGPSAPAGPDLRGAPAGTTDCLPLDEREACAGIVADQTDSLAMCTRIQPRGPMNWAQVKACDYPPWDTWREACGDQEESRQLQRCGSYQVATFGCKNRINGPTEVYFYRVSGDVAGCRVSWKPDLPPTEYGEIPPLARCSPLICEKELP